MINIYQQFTLFQLAIIFLTAFLAGIDRAGFKGIIIPIVPFVASIIDTRLSVALLLLIFFSSDLFGIIYYKRSVDIKILLKLFPSALIGLTIGLITGNYISPEIFKFVLAIVIAVCLILMILKELKNFSPPKSILFSYTSGFAGGFTTMIGNAAMPIMNMFFLSLNLSKNVLIGTVTWFFFTVNFVKIPLHIFVWKSITLINIFQILLTFPIIVLGFFIGIRLIKYLNEQKFRIFIIIMTFAALIRLFI